MCSMVGATKLSHRKKDDAESVIVRAGCTFYGEASVAEHNLTLPLFINKPGPRPSGDGKRESFPMN